MGKRGRPAFRRTTSMTGFAVQLGNIEASPPATSLGAQIPMIGGEFDHMLPPRCNQNNYSVDELQLETADFLRSCGLCNLRLIPGRDIYMYRGDTAFCSLECREHQMKQDERKERRATAAAAVAINGQSHRSELVAAAPDAAGKTGTIVAA